LYAKQLNRKIISYLETDSALSYHDVLHQFFCYPFLIFLNAENSSESSVSVLQDLEVESTIEIYRSLSTNSCNSKLSSMVFFDGFYKYLVCTIDGNMALFQANLEHLSDKFENATILSALGEIVIGLLQNDQMLIYANQELKETSEDSAVCRQRKLFLNWFKLANRFVDLHFQMEHLYLSWLP
jgi:telomere-associated protein RIF1